MAQQQRQRRRSSRTAATAAAAAVVSESPLLPGESPEDAILRLHGAPEGQYRYRIQRESTTTPGDWADLDLARVTEPQELDSIEEFVISLVKARGWGAGRYRYTAYYGRGSQRYRFEPVEINVDAGMPGVRTTATGDAPASPLATVTEAFKLAEQARSLGTGGHDSARAALDAVRAGVEVASAAAPKPIGMTEILALARELRGEAPKPDPLATKVLETAIERLMAPPEEVEEPEKPKTMLEQLEEARAMIALIGGRGGAVAIEPTVVLLAKAVVPHIAPMLNDIGAALRSWAEGFCARPTVIAGPPAPAALPPATATTAPTQDAGLAGFVAFVDAQVPAGAASFPLVIERFEASIQNGKAYLDQIRAGGMDHATAFAAVVQVLKQHRVTLRSETYDYLSRLFVSLAPPKPAEPRYVCVRKCSACGASIGYVSTEEAKADQQPCPKCQGALGDGISETTGSTDGATA